MSQDKKEKALCKLRERHGLIDQINLDLTYAVCFNLANCYHQNGMRKEVRRIGGAHGRRRAAPSDDFLNGRVDKPMQALPQSTLGCPLVHQALREYGAIVKNKQYPQAGRLRANIGNIYYEQVTAARTAKALRIVARVHHIPLRRGGASTAVYLVPTDLVTSILGLE